jgi:hypothetical protein
MRVLIISPQRTGGNVFSKWLTHELSYIKGSNESSHQRAHEPFNINHNLIDKIDYFMQLDNVVMKVNPFEWRNYIDDKTLYNSFDKIIGLTREDVLDSAISYTKAIETNNFNKKYLLHNQWIVNNKEIIENNYNNLLEFNNFVKGIENALQVTYEGIYQNKNDIEKIKKFIGINDLKYVDMLDNKNRYRNNNNAQKLI